MDKILVKTPKQLHNFLKILAEEAVASARNSPPDARSQQAAVSADIKQSSSKFMREEDPPEASSASPAEPKPEPPAAAPAESGKEITAKFDALKDAINTVRGAGSLRDGDIEKQLRDYYNKLSNAEAASAILYIQTIADVLNRSVEGARAQDPSDFDIVTTMKDGDERQDPEPMTAAPSKPIAGPAPEEPETDPEEIEPPIKVGNSQQVTEAYRQRIRALMRGQ